MIAKDGEEKVNVLYESTAYHTQKDYMCPVQSSTFQYPVIANVNTKNVPSCVWYSTTKDNGHFGVPKVIFGVKSSGVYIDKEGEYGMEQHCAGIVDDVENLEDIAKAMQTPEFIKLMTFADVGGVNDRYNRKIIALFRKDFWKDFV